MAGLVAAVAAEAAMEPGTVRRAGGGASVVGGTPGGAVPAGAAGDGEGRGGAPTATVRPCAADARGPERPVRRTAVLQLSVDFRPAVVRFCSGRTGIANEGRGMDETIERARTLDRAGRRIEVLILVKTTPTPSATYEDTVCVAGVALSPGPMRWVRLYPIPFRHLDSASQFQKYTVVAVDVKQPKRDGRPESLRVDLANIAIERRHEPGSARYLLMDRIERTTTCRLIAGTREDVNATSLGIVRPRDASLVLKPHRGWSASQQRSLQKWERQAPLPLGGLGHNDAPPLENPPLQAWYRYRCGGGRAARDTSRECSTGSLPPFSAGPRCAVPTSGRGCATCSRPACSTPAEIRASSWATTPVRANAGPSPCSASTTRPSERFSVLARMRARSSDQRAGSSRRRRDRASYRPRQ